MHIIIIIHRGILSYPPCYLLELLLLQEHELKFIYSEKVIKFCEISTVDLTGTMYIRQIYGGDFAKFCGLLRIYELYCCLKALYSGDE